MADPRVTDKGLQNEFVRGFSEAREVTTDVIYEVHLTFEGAYLRAASFDDLDEAVAALREHIRHGYGASGTITVVMRASEDDEEVEEQRELPKGVSG